MKDLSQREKIVDICLKKLSEQFDVRKPQWFIEDPWQRKPDIAGVFKPFPPHILFNPKWIKKNIAVALEVARHEFAHYLIAEKRYDYDCLYGLTERQQEKACRKFEQDIFALRLLPKGQTTLSIVSICKDAGK